MSHSCHILVADNPAIIYSSRGGTPDRVLPLLEPFLQKFWQERESLGEHGDTPECLVAQIVVRFGFEYCEDDFSNLRVGVRFNSQAEYLYEISRDRSIQVWVPDERYRQTPELGIQGCQLWRAEASADCEL